MCAGHAVHAACHTHQTHDPKLLTSYTSCPNCTLNTLLVETTALLMTQHAKVVGKRVTGELNASALTPLVCKHPIINPASRVMKRGEESQAAKAKTEKDPHIDLFVAAMDCRT